MGRSTCSHSDRYTLGSVDQEIGDADRKNQGFFFGFIEIRPEIRHILVQIGQKGLFGDLLQPGFGVTHGSGTITFYIAEIPMAVYQGQSLFKLLRHHDQRVIDGTVAMGMIFTHCVAHDAGALSVRTVRPDPEFIHIVECPALHRLEAVPHIRQSPGYDYTHGIVYISLLHQLGIFGAYDLLSAAGSVISGPVKNTLPRSIIFLFTHSCVPYIMKSFKSNLKIKCSGQI